MRAGKLRRRVSIEHPAQIRGASGASTTNWVELARVWAGYDPAATGGDRLAGDQRTAVQTRICRIRYRDGVTPKMRLVDGANVYEIVDVADDDKTRELVLTLKAVEAKARG
jgi:SPP1 family predicted phage head-tail adaptor